MNWPYFGHFGLDLWAEQLILVKIGYYIQHQLVKVHFILNSRLTAVKLEEKYMSGLLIGIYNTATQECSIYEGEDSEQKQIERLRNFKRCF